MGSCRGVEAFDADRALEVQVRACTYLHPIREIKLFMMHCLGNRDFPKMGILARVCDFEEVCPPFSNRRSCRRFVSETCRNSRAHFTDMEEQIQQMTEAKAAILPSSFAPKTLLQNNIDL